MDTTDKLKQLVQKCKCGIELEINPNRDYYQSVEEYLRDMQSRGVYDWLSEELIQQMIKADTIIDLCFYPNTPISQCRIVGHDLDEVLDSALKEFEGRT